jgi:glycyl-tRNA synthetase beta chain
MARHPKWLPSTSSVIRILQGRAYSISLTELFEPLAVGFKRVVNIVRKEAETGATLGDVDPDALVAEEEKALWEAYKDAAGDLEVALGNRDWDAACHVLIGLKSPVDDFFDNVMVNAEDEALRKNRLALLDDL